MSCSGWRCTVVKVETDEDNHYSKGRWRRQRAWRTDLACLLCILVSFLLSISPLPHAIMHCKVISSVSYSSLFVCVIQDDNPLSYCVIGYIQVCVLLLLTLHMHVSTAIFGPPCGRGAVELGTFRFSPLSYMKQLPVESAGIRIQNI